MKVDRSTKSGLSIKKQQLCDRSEGINLKSKLGIPVTKLSAGFKAKNNYSRKHEGKPLDGLQETVRLILEKGSFAQDGHVLTLWSEGYRVVIALDNLKIIGYETIHHSRTLSDVRSGVPSKSKGRVLNYRSLIDTLDDDAIDKIKIPYTIVKQVQAETDLNTSEVHDFIRDSIADGLDSAETELKNLGDGRFLKESLSYTYIKGKGHRISSHELTVILRNDGLRVKEVALNN